MRRWSAVARSGSATTPQQAVVQAVAKDADGVAGLVYRSSRPSVPSFLASGPSRVRGMFVPRSRALAQSSIRDLLKKRNRPQRLKEVHIDTAAVLRDLTLVRPWLPPDHGNRPRSLRFHW